MQVARDAYIVLSEVLPPDCTPHPTNARATIENDPDLWMGFEHEYFLFQEVRPSAFPGRRPPRTPHGRILLPGRLQINGGPCARKIVAEHMDLCLHAGINHAGINAEVAKGQWEFQIFVQGSAKC